jgi:glycosyltransferase involved in cell wall biosynthesis
MAERVLKQVPTAQFVGVGAGEQLDFLKAEAKRRGLSGQIQFPGFRADIAEVLACLDVAVLTSLWEGLPRALVQAAACGVPAVTFEVEGAREVVKDGVNGYVVPSKDVDQLADRVINLLAHPDRARAMGMAGSALVHDAWTIESMVRDITAVYEALASENGGGPGARGAPKAARPR